MTVVDVGSVGEGAAGDVALVPEAVGAAVGVATGVAGAGVTAAVGAGAGSADAGELVTAGKVARERTSATIHAVLFRIEFTVCLS